MNEETRKHISDQYFQGNTPQAVLGNGLGLTLVKRILDKISNTITVSSTLGEGSTFIVTLHP